MSRVTIGRTPGESAAGKYHPISRFRNTLKAYARIFHTDIVGKWEQKMLPASAPAGAVVVNFFEEGFADDTYSTRKSAFGYAFDEEVRCLRSTVLFSDIGRPQLMDFDGKPLAHALARSIYIDFDFLRTCWDGHDEVLRIILAWGLARMETSIEYSLIGVEFAKYVRERCAKGAASESRKFSVWAKETSGRLLHGYEQKLTDLMQASVEGEARFVETMRNVDAFEAFNREIPDTLSTEQLEEDFDRLRNLFGVARVRITREGRIAIATHRLEQIFPPPAEAVRAEPSKPYDVGSIEFSIDPLAELSTSIHFRVLEQGAYQNAFLFPSRVAKVQVCFGSNAQHGGLNMAIEKLLVNYRIPDVAAHVLTFFRFVNSRPVAGPFTTEPVSDEKGTADIDWECEKKRYVDLMQATMAARTKKERMKELNTLVNEREAAFTAVKKCWEAAHELALVRRYVQKCAVTGAENAKMALDRLQKHPQVLGFDMENGLRIWFEMPKVFTYPSILWIQEDGAMRLVSFLEYWAHTENHAIVWDWNGERAPMELLARGMYAELVSTVMNVAYNLMQQAYSIG